MKAIFADTFYWVALTNPLDAAHIRAKEFSEDIVTTQEVLTEYLNFFSAGPEYMRRKATISARAIFQDADIRVILQSNSSFNAGFDLFSAEADKGYSLTDCISMHTMRQLGLADILTNDHHFEQDGFKALFRDAA